ncbi:hypothetical protein GSI_04151 [Ganoderma sinense ZZ0214-1]|uniref:Uncharacterized protein n=1 Tax=Ganoderma sinense ZZ0214-1 TaxID=1077348 RepID=A0A2G8SIZ7_9APHY|nr:hypothetical protein GSI_04151 [Ganoderma sinense ZZ0214-1]
MAGSQLLKAAAPTSADSSAAAFSSSALDVAVNPKSPSYDEIIASDAAPYPASKPPVQSPSTQHWNPRSLASRAVVVTQHSVVTPTTSRCVTPRAISLRWRLELQNAPLPGLSTTTSPGRGRSSSTMSCPCCPRTSSRPMGPCSPMPSVWCPAGAASWRSRLAALRSARSGRWPSRVWTTCRPRVRAAARTAAAAGTTERTPAKTAGLPHWMAPKPPGSTKSRWMSIRRRAVRRRGKVYG